MTKPVAILWGLLTLVPFAGISYFPDLATGPEVIMSMDERLAEFEEIRGQFRVYIWFFIGLVVSYITYLFKTDHVPPAYKRVWAVALIVGNMAAMPVFWFFFVWRPIKTRQTSNETI